MDGYYLTKRQRLDDLRAQLDQDYNSFYNQYKDLNDYFLPTRGRFVLSTDSNRGDRRNHKIFDPTGYMAARTLSSGMQAGVTSPARPWKRITTPDPELAEYGAVREWLELVDQRMSTFFLRSNLYNVLPIAYADLGVFGTSAIFMEKDKDTVARFMSFPVGSYRIATDRSGRVNVFFREYRMTVRQVVSEFGKKDEETGKPDMSVFSENVRRLYERGQYETWVEVCHFIEPNEDYNPSRLDSKFKRFSSCYYEKSNGNYDQYLRESGYDFFPVLVPRWQTTGMDAYGTDSPGMVSIGDNKQLQHGERRAAQAIDKMINPPIKASSNLKKSKVSLVAGDITYVDDMNEGLQSIHEVRLDLSHLTAKQQEVRERINKAFYVDLFLMLASSDRRDYTATEIMERKEEKLLALGPVLEQLNQDILDPLIDNMFFLMNEAGFIPDAPQELQGQPLKVEYISIMAQAQKMVGVGALDKILAVGSQVMQLNPSSADKLDFDQLIDAHADALGVSPRIVRSDEKVQEIRAEKAKAAAQQQQMAMISQGAKAAKDLSGANLEGDNALSRLSEQLTGQPA